MMTMPGLGSRPTFVEVEVDLAMGKAVGLL